jgi:hypothetical protein
MNWKDSQPRKAQTNPQPLRMRPGFCGPRGFPGCIMFDSPNVAVFFPSEATPSSEGPRSPRFACFLRRAAPVQGKSFAHQWLVPFRRMSIRRRGICSRFDGVFGQKLRTGTWCLPLNPRGKSGEWPDLTTITTMSYGSLC